MCYINPTESSAIINIIIIDELSSWYNHAI